MDEAGFQVGEGGEQKGAPKEDRGNRLLYTVVITEGKGRRKGVRYEE